MSENDKFERHHRHRTVFFPVLLILIGVFFLLSNMNMVSGSAWALVVRFWPILFLLGAIDDLLNYKWVGAVFNIGIGSVLLLANLGYFPWTAWEMIFRLWPIFLIALGLDIVFRGESIFGSLIGVSISVVVVGALVWFALQSPLVGNGQALEISQSAESAEQVEMRIQPAVADLQIQSEPNQEQLLTGVVMLAEQETLTDDYFVNNKTGHLNLSSHGTVILPSKTQKDGFLWDLSLNDEIPLKLEVEQGVGQQVLDLQDVNLQSLVSNLGVGQLTITLPDQGEFEGDLECSIGELVIRVPENMAVKFVLDTAITSVNFPSGFYREGDVIYSDESKAEGDINTVLVEIAIGSLRIETVR